MNKKSIKINHLFNKFASGNYHKTLDEEFTDSMKYSNSSLAAEGYFLVYYLILF